LGHGARGGPRLWGRADSPPRRGYRHEEVAVTDWPEAWAKAGWVGLGGFLGANARYWIGGWVQELWGTAFPWSTFVISISGSFLLGLFVTLISERYVVRGAPT